MPNLQELKKNAYTESEELLNYAEKYWESIFKSQLTSKIISLTENGDTAPNIASILIEYIQSYSEQNTIKYKIIALTELISNVHRYAEIEHLLTKDASFNDLVNHANDLLDFQAQHFQSFATLENEILKISAENSEKIPESDTSFESEIRKRLGSIRSNSQETLKFLYDQACERLKNHPDTKITEIPKLEVPSYENTNITPKSAPLAKVAARIFFPPSPKIQARQVQEEKEVSILSLSS